MAEEAKSITSHNRYREQVLAGIARYNRADRHDVLAFRSTMYGADSIFADGAYFDWLYEHPYQSSRGQTTFWVYRKAAQIEGHLGGLQTSLKVGSHCYEALWLMDLMVSPRYRLRGVGAVLAEGACREREVVLGIEISVAARKTLLRAGWADLATVPLYIRPLDLHAVLRKHGRFDLHPILGRAGSAALWVTAEIGRAGAALCGLKMEEVAHFDERVDRLWAQSSYAYPVVCRRDSSFLNWRFAQFPQPERYRLFHLVRGAAVVGYAVLRVGERGGLWAGFLVDFFCAPRWTYFLVAHCLRFFTRHRVQIVYCLHHNPVASAAFTALGFARRDSMWPLMLQAHGLSPEASTLVRDPRNWFITAADSDADRPSGGTNFAPDLLFAGSTPASMRLQQ